MKITRDEARLLTEAIETRIRALTQFLQHPVLSTCMDDADRARISDATEKYAGLMRKIKAADGTLLRRELL